MSGDFTASLVEAVRGELKGFGLDVRGRGERRLSLRPAGLELWLKFSRPVDTGVSTVVWATFEVPVLSHLDEDVAPVACAALNRRFPFLCATAAAAWMVVGRRRPGCRLSVGPPPERHRALAG